MALQSEEVDMSCVVSYVCMNSNPPLSLYQGGIKHYYGSSEGKHPLVYNDYKTFFVGLDKISFFPCYCDILFLLTKSTYFVFQFTHFALPCTQKR